eukprot:scpid105284/ scgid26073/ 
MHMAMRITNLMTAKVIKIHPVVHRPRMFPMSQRLLQFETLQLNSGMHGGTWTDDSGLAAASDGGGIRRRGGDGVIGGVEACSVGGGARRGGDGGGTRLGGRGGGGDGEHGDDDDDAGVTSRGFAWM